MKILLTGAFGNLGTSCLAELTDQNYSIRCFDIKSKMTETRAKIYSKKYPNIEIFWGDILDKNSIHEALKEIDAVIHTAAIIPPLSEKNPDLAKKINVVGTQNLLEEAESSSTVKQIIFASSVSVHGRQNPSNPPVKTTDPFKPTDTYTHTKVECEGLVTKSKLNWTIVRFGAIMPVESRGQSQSLDEYSIEMLFGIPLEQKVEAIHSRDAGLSLVNAINNSDAYNQVFFGGGGSKNQLIEKDFIFKTLKQMGVGKIPDNYFKEAKSEEDWFYTHWMDTDKSQAVLNYQRKTFDDYLQDSKPPISKKLIFFFLGPIIKRTLKKRSPYKH